MMEFFLDTAEVSEVAEIASWGILDGVTTNPSLIKKSGRDFKQVVKEIAEICEKYANGGIGELMRIAEDVAVDDLFRGYAKKIRELIETKSK